MGRFPVCYEHAILEEISALERHGIRSRIIGFHPSGETLDPEFSHLADSVDYLDAGASRRPLISRVRSLVSALLAGWLRPSDFRNVLRVSDIVRRAHHRILIRQGPPDVVHAQFGHLGLLALPVAQSEKIPLVVSFRGRDVLLIQQAPARAREALFGYASRVFARSEDMRQDLLRLGCAAGKLFVLPSGINVRSIPFRERTHPGAGDPVILLMVGRLVPKKGMDDALRALARCRPGPVLTILGDGPEKDRLLQLHRELGHRHTVVVGGPTVHWGIYEGMLSGHIFLLPCKTAPDGEKEGVPNAIKEAQATGMPVLSTRHAGIPECVEHGGSGLLCEEGDVDGLARNLEELLAHPERWAAMGRRGRELMEERYDLARLAPELARHYHDIVEGHEAAN